MNNISKLYVGVAVAALLSNAGGAKAQVAGAQPTGLQEVIVTAQRRPENAQKAPLAVTSLNADLLTSAHVTGATDLSRIVPDLKVSVGGTAGDPGGTAAVFSIRGLGASATGPQGSSGVAVHLDGIYSNAGVSNSEFFDLERIEVDPGPQGTLYGRSAAAGAVNILPNKPTSKFGGEATLEVGNYGAVRSEGVINLPVNDQLFLRGSFQTQNHNGYLTNGYDDLDAKAARIQVLYKPTEQLSIRLYGDYLNLGGRGASNVFVSGATLPYIASLAPPQNNSDPRSRSIANYCFVNGQVVNTCYQSINVNKWSTHLDISYNLGWGVLSVIPSYAERNQTAANANAPLPLSTYNLAPYTNHQTNLEVRLNDPGNGPLKWVGGFNVYKNDVINDNTQAVDPLAGLLPVFGNGPTRPPTGTQQGVVAINALNDQASTQNSYAVFGQVTYSVLPWLRLTGGGRYNEDNSKYNGSLTTNSQIVYYVNGGPFPITTSNVTSPITTGPLSSSANFHALTYRFAIDADVTPTSLVYGSIGSGYKPGGLSDGGAASTNTAAGIANLATAYNVTAAQLAKYEPSNVFGPENVTHYEIGTKNRFLENRLQVNDAIYYDDYQNYQNGQTEVVNPLPYRVQGFIVTNAGKAQIYGNEFALTYKVTPNDIFGGSLNYLHAKFTNYIAAAYLTPSAITPSVNLSGLPLPNAPEWSGSLSYQHFFDLADGSQLTASIFSALTAGYQTDYAESPGTQQSSYTRTTLDLTWKSNDRLWRVTGFVNNLENNLIKSFGLASAGYSQVHYDPPRTFGVSATRTF